MSRITLRDVAKSAGVSAATVDRVLNGRSGVRPATVERVEEAIRKLNYQPDRLAARLARGQDYRFCFVLPLGPNTFMQMLKEEIGSVADRLRAERVVIDLEQTDVFDGPTLADTIEHLGEAYDGLAVVALDHPTVREAITTLTASGVHVVTLVSDVPGAARVHFVGIDNTAAGRTAATLLGRFVGPREGAVGLVAGSLALRDHVERQVGFEQVLTQEFPGLRLLPVREGRDDHAQVRMLTTQLLKDVPDLVGIYNVGGGNRGIVAALEEARRDQNVIFIAHELTQFSRKALVRGTIDAILHQDPGHEARSAARVLMAECDGLPIVAGQERISIDIFLRDNVP